MPRKSKIPPEEKIFAVEAYLCGKLGTAEALQRYSINKSTWQNWIILYNARGSEGLVPQSKNRKYSPEMKEKVVQEYISGKSSLRELCKKYSISCHGMVMTWIKRYNGHKE